MCIATASQPRKGYELPRTFITAGQLQRQKRNQTKKKIKNTFMVFHVNRSIIMSYHKIYLPISQIVNLKKDLGTCLQDYDVLWDGAQSHLPELAVQDMQNPCILSRVVLLRSSDSEPMSAVAGSLSQRADYRRISRVPQRPPETNPPTRYFEWGVTDPCYTPWRFVVIYSSLALEIE
jgi:hypothetical protein